MEALAAAEAAAEADLAAAEAVAEDSEEARVPEDSEEARAPAASAAVHIIDPREDPIGASGSGRDTAIITTAPDITAADASVFCWFPS